MGKRLAIVIGAAALGVIALGAQTAAAAPQETAAAPQVVKYDTKLGMYAERGGLYDGYVKSELRKCTEGRRVVLYKLRSGADRKFATARSVGGWWEVDTDRVELPRTGGLAYAKVMPKVGDGFVCRADRSETRGLFVPPRH